MLLSPDTQTTSLLDAPVPPDVDPFDDLNQLLAGAVAHADKQKALNHKTRSSILGSIVYNPQPSYLPKFSCAVFILQTCSCGSITWSFSHFAEYQEFSGKAAGKPNRWFRVDARPAVLANPRFIEKATLACSSCLDVDTAVVLGHPTQEELDVII